MELRIKEVAKAKGEEMKTIAKKLGITYQALNARITGNPSKKVLQEIADVLGCSVIELIEPEKEYTHVYDPDTSEWLGVRKKSKI
jgi:transcriptional regulator with XRE-family HTH domain